jgi:hypothetical protein
MRLISELDTADQRAKELAQGLTPLQLNWKPSQDAWSVGQCLEHLRVANEVYLPAITASLRARPLLAVQDITPGWFGLWFIRNYIEPSPESKRARAPKKIAPSPRVGPHILDLFLISNQAARELVVHRSHTACMLVSPSESCGSRHDTEIGMTLKLAAYDHSRRNRSLSFDGSRRLIFVNHPFGSFYCDFNGSLEHVREQPADTRLGITK